MNRVVHVDQIQEKIVTEMEEPIVESRPEAVKMEQPKDRKAPRTRKERRIKLPPKELKFRLSKFDFILLQLLKEGKTDLEEVRKTFNLEKQEFCDRLTQLRDANYLAFDESRSLIGLSMRGVNDYSLKWRKAADEWLGRKEKKIKVKAESLAEKPQQAEDKPEVINLANTIQAKLPLELLYKELETRHAKILELPEEKRAEETIDIMDLMKRYGPTESQRDLLTKKSPFVERYMSKNGLKEGKNKKAEQPKGQVKSEEMENKASNENPTAAKPYYNRAISELSRQAAEIEEKGEKCELCKTGFLISVKADEHNPKYGHCFCGAPYHKDCYEGIVAGDGKCIKCGRKLGSGSDFKMEEAFKQIRDISF